MSSSVLRRVIGVVALFFIAGWCLDSTDAQTSPQQVSQLHARQVRRLLIRGGMLIPGTAAPAYGPTDVLVENGTIARVGSAADEHWPQADATIDAAGKYVMPGIVNTHMHWHETRVGPLPIQYERNLYLASGITTAREVGGNFEK